jgi:hypothetical protein
MRAHTHAPPWSQAEDDTVRRMVAGAFDDEAIARAVGRTRIAVASRRRTLGVQAVPGVAWTEAEDAILRQRCKAGLADPEIAAELGRTTDGVTGRRRLLAIGKQPRWTEAEDAMFETMTPREVATATGRSIKACHTRRAMIRNRADLEGQQIAAARSRRLLRRGHEEAA